MIHVIKMLYEIFKLELIIINNTLNSYYEISTMKNSAKFIILLLIL